MCRDSTEMTTPKPFRCDLCEEGIDSRRQASKHFHKVHGGLGTFSLSSAPLKRKRHPKSVKAKPIQIIDLAPRKKAQRKAKPKQVLHSEQGRANKNTLSAKIPTALLLLPGKLIPVEILDREQLRSKVQKGELADHTYAKQYDGCSSEDPPASQAVTMEGIAQESELTPAPESSSTSEIDIGQVKVDRSIPSSLSYCDEIEDNQSAPPAIPLHLTDVIKSEVGDEAISNLVLIECDICHLKVSDLSTHLYTEHYDPAGNELITSDLDNRYSPCLSSSMPDNDGTSEFWGDSNFTPSNAEPAPRPPTPPNDPSDHFTFKEKTGKYSCNSCKRQFSLKQTVNRHYKTAHLNLLHHCDACKRTFRDRSQYVAHHKTAHQGFRFTCPICSKAYSHKGNLVHHQQTSLCRLKTVTVGNVVQFKIASYVGAEDLSRPPRKRGGPKAGSLHAPAKVIPSTSTVLSSSSAHVRSPGPEPTEQFNRETEGPHPNKKRFIVCKVTKPGVICNKPKS